MNLATFMFYFFEGVAATSAIALLFIRNVFYAALLVIVCLLAIAGVYVLAFAEFIAVTQVLVYAGGILVVILFGIMLTTRISGKAPAVEHVNTYPSIVTGAAFFLVLTYFITQEFSSAETPTFIGESIQHLGIGLMTDFILPFETAGIVMLIALIGAAVMASTAPSKKP